jgi:parallel beta-helix repeat protein
MSGKPIGICGSRTGRILVKASDLVTGWTLYSGAIWRHPGWSINSQQAIVDGKPLQQIGSSTIFNLSTGAGSFLGKPDLPPVGSGLQDMTPGSFYRDPSSNTLYVWLPAGDSPNNHSVEASVRRQALRVDWLNGAGNFGEIHDVEFWNSNGTADGVKGGVGEILADNWLLTDVKFNQGDFAGLTMTGDHQRVYRSEMNFNGNTGLTYLGGGPKYNWQPPDVLPLVDVVYEGNDTSFNNYRNWNWHWHAGGVKSIRAPGVIFRAHLARSNNGPGIWCDGWCRNVVVERSVLIDNVVGIFYEISSFGSIHDNVVSGSGITISNSSDTQVFNNTVYNAGYGIMVAGNERQPLQRNTVRNNIIAGSTVTDLVINPTITNSANGNLFQNKFGYPRIGWGQYGANYTSLTTFYSQTGNEAGGLYGNPSFVTASEFDFRIGPNSSALNKGVDVSAGKLDVYGAARVSGIRIDIGAAEYQLNAVQAGP